MDADAGPIVERSNREVNRSSNSHERDPNHVQDVTTHDPMPEPPVERRFPSRNGQVIWVWMTVVDQEMIEGICCRRTQLIFTNRGSRVTNFHLCHFPKNRKKHIRSVSKFTVHHLPPRSHLPTVG